MNFQELKKVVLVVAEKKAPNCSQTKKLRECNTIDELCEVAKDNIGWVRNNLPIQELVQKYDNPEVFNVGKDNTGLFNSGNRNSGNRNSGDLNSGYRNSGVFCTRKREDTVSIFNKGSGMTWDEWYKHPAYSAACDLMITEWVSWNGMTDEEKKSNPKAFVTEGYVKVYTYHEAWANLWEKLSDSEKNSFKTLPNYDPDIFEEVTGIRFE